MNDVIKELKSVEIGELIIDQESIEQVREILAIAERSVESLRAARNTVVRAFGEMAEEARKNGDMVEFCLCMTKISGITAVIDNELWSRGEHV